MKVDFEHPANAGLLKYLRSKCTADDPALQSRRSCSPQAVNNPYYNLGTHPDLVERFWDEIVTDLPVDCRWVVYGIPTLVHPASGIIFGFAGGTHTYALRLPLPEREQAMAVNPKRLYKYTGGGQLDLDGVGEDWVFCSWKADEVRWCNAAYDYAGSIKGKSDDTAGD